ncbi:MAG: hypothetical protein J5441_03545 [Clostridia bacterium]|nr:hypothetical protein [Clostridia bacterium]
MPKTLSELLQEGRRGKKPERVVYISCDVATQARDLKLFAERGYKTVKAQGIDMFPRTAHVESVVLITKM